MKYESSFKSEADGLEISVMALMPDKKPYRAVVQLVHGMSEHKERYIPFMQYLAKLGYVVVIHDHRGHGKSVKHQDDLGFTYGGGAQAMLQDIRTVNRKIHAYYPELPLILMGHSMGSLAVRAFVAEHDSCVDMLIVCGSPSYNTAMPLGVAIAKTEKAVFGPRHRSKLIETMSFGAGAMKFRKDKRCTAWICSDPDVAKEYEESEMCGFTFTDDAYLALFELMKRAYDVEHFSCTNPDMPVLFVSGAEDPCLINVRHFAKTVRAMRRAGYKDVKGKLYPGMRHEILNEIGVVKQRPQLFGDKVDEKFGVKLLQFEVEGLCAVLAEPVAQQVALRLAEFNVIHDGAFSVKGLTTAGLRSPLVRAGGVTVRPGSRRRQSRRPPPTGGRGVCRHGTTASARLQLITR